MIQQLRFYATLSRVIWNTPPIAKAQWRAVTGMLVVTIFVCCLGKAASLVVELH